jgi:hypothetical protein
MRAALAGMVRDVTGATRYRRAQIKRGFRDA